MKKTIHSTLLLVCVLFSINLHAQSFTALYDFANVTVSSGRTDPSPVPIVTGTTFGSFQASANFTNSNAGNRFSFLGQDLGAINGSNTFTGVINSLKYYEVTLTPQAYYSLDLDSITFTLQRSGTGIRQYAVRASLDGFGGNLPAAIQPANDSLQIVGANVFQVTDGSTVAVNGSKILLTGYTSLTTPITFRFYGFNAEAVGGTFSIDNVRFYGTTTISLTAPNIIPSTLGLNFPATAAGGSGSVFSYTLNGSNLTGPVNLSTATANFTIADNAGGPFTNNIIIPEADIASGKTIFVKFLPNVTGTLKDTILHTSPSATNKKVALVGDAIDPANLSFNFNSCINGGQPGTGFTSYSVTGAQTWTCTTFGRNTTNGVNMNGFSGGAQENEDWLISPSLHFSTLTLPVLRFWSRGEFAGPSLEAFVSTDYIGYGDPNAATWTNLNASFPPLTNTWTITDGIELTAYKAFPNVVVAFRYKSSAEDGAARWSIDDVDITNRSSLLAVSQEAINFEETSIGNYSAAKRISVKAIGYGDVTITAPANFQLSVDSINYNSSLNFLEANISSVTDIFVRFAPLTKELKIEGYLRFTGTGLDSLRVLLTGTSYPKSETFDVGTYNLSFFGSNFTNNPTPEKIATQVANIATVFNRLKLDITGVQEVSSDIAMDSLVSKLDNHKYVLSPRWSYSFDAPDPNFPPQKIGFVYDNTTAVLISSRAMFTGIYDSARNGYPEKIPNYPGGTPQSFWASGRLPFMGTFDVTIEGVTQRVIVVDIHAKSASDAPSYNRRVYDVNVLKDSLNMYYSNDMVIILGDYNDRVMGSIYTSAPNSPYKPFVDDNSKYTALTYALDVAGRVSYIGGTGLIDHIIISNELAPFYISGSTEIEDPRTYISSYNATTASDHLPVFSRFNFAAALPVTLTNLDALARTNDILVTWKTSLEVNSYKFMLEKSLDAINFHSIANVLASGNANGSSYQAVDSLPAPGRNFYRLKQIDLDGSWVYSPVVSVLYTGAGSNEILLFPNPVLNYVTLRGYSAAQVYNARLVSNTGTVALALRGTLYQLNQQINSKLGSISPGFYVLQLENGKVVENLKFIKQ